MERFTYRGRNGKGYVRNQDYYNHVSLQLARVAERLTDYEDTGLEPEEIPLVAEMQRQLEAYLALGTVEQLTELVNTEQQRQEGCRRCWNGECTMSGFDYSCETTCDKCRYNLKDKQFCTHCGRDLRGESKND